MAACKKCGVRIKWIITSTGKKMPIDENPPHDKKPITVQTVDGAMEVVPHFATCPYADEFKRKRG